MATVVQQTSHVPKYMEMMLRSVDSGLDRKLERDKWRAKEARQMRNRKEYENIVGFSVPEPAPIGLNQMRQAPPQQTTTQGAQQGGPGPDLSGDADIRRMSAEAAFRDIYKDQPPEKLEQFIQEHPAQVMADPNVKSFLSKEYGMAAMSPNAQQAQQQQQYAPHPDFSNMTVDEQHQWQARNYYRSMASTQDPAERAAMQAQWERYNRGFETRWYQDPTHNYDRPDPWIDRMTPRKGGPGAPDMIYVNITGSDGNVHTRAMPRSVFNKGDKAMRSFAEKTFTDIVKPGTSAADMRISKAGTEGPGSKDKSSLDAIKKKEELIQYHIRMANEDRTNRAYHLGKLRDLGITPKKNDRGIFFWNPAYSLDENSDGGSADDLDNMMDIGM